MNKFVLLVLVLFISSLIFAEAVTKKPFKAAALSFFVPGSGQLYNEAYLKSGIVIALEGSLIGLAVYHNSKAEYYYDRYKISEDEEDYNNYLDYYYKRQNDFWWIGVVIFLSSIDAFVDAHLFNFEEKKNKIHLKFEDNVIGLSYSF